MIFPLWPPPNSPLPLSLPSAEWDSDSVQGGVLVILGPGTEPVCFRNGEPEAQRGSHKGEARCKLKGMTVSQALTGVAEPFP